MKEIWTAKLGQAAARYGENAPVATACCNACRTCVTTNAVALTTAALAGAGAVVARFAGRLRKGASPASP